MSRAGSTVTVRLFGELDLATRYAGEAIVPHVLQGRPHSLILDVRGLRFIDVHGYRAIDDLAGRVTGAGCSVLLVLAPDGPPPVIVGLLYETADRYDALVGTVGEAPLAL